MIGIESRVNVAVKVRKKRRKAYNLFSVWELSGVIISGIQGGWWGSRRGRGEIVLVERFQPI